MNIFQSILKYGGGKTILYQMGKVGSSTLLNSIPNAIQIHDLYYNPPCYVHRKLRYGKGVKYALHRLSLVARRHTLTFGAGKTKIVCVIRDPLSRNISMFFQSLPYWIIEYQTGITRGNTGVGATSEDSDFLSNCFETVFDHEYPCEWIERELIRFTKLDVYAEKFDKNMGYGVYSNDNFDILIVDMLSIDRNSLYRDFKANYKPSERVISTLFNSRYHKHFYE